MRRLELAFLASLALAVGMAAVPRAASEMAPTVVLVAAAAGAMRVAAAAAGAQAEPSLTTQARSKL